MHRIGEGGTIITYNRGLAVKKIAFLLLLILAVAGCEGPTHSVLIKNESHYQVVLRLSGHKSNDDRLILAPNQSRTVLFYTFGNAELISKNRNTLYKSEKLYSIKDTAPIPVTFYNTIEKHITVKETYNLFDETPISAGGSVAVNVYAPLDALQITATTASSDTYNIKIHYKEKSIFIVP